MQRLRPRRLFRCRQRQRLGKLPPRFDPPAAHVPAPPLRADQTHTPRRGLRITTLTTFHEPPMGGAEVVSLPLQVCEPGELLVATQFRLRLFGQLEEVGGVT